MPAAHRAPSSCEGLVGLLAYGLGERSRGPYKYFNTLPSSSKQRCGGCRGCCAMACAQEATLPQPQAVPWEEADAEEGFVLQSVPVSSSCSLLIERRHVEAVGQELEEEEESEQEGCVDPFFFDPGYSVAGTTGFLIWVRCPSRIESCPCASAAAYCRLPSSASRTYLHSCTAGWCGGPWPLI